jgi:hypothetical protein
MVLIRHMCHACYMYTRKFSHTPTPEKIWRGARLRAGTSLAEHKAVSTSCARMRHVGGRKHSQNDGSACQTRRRRWRCLFVRRGGTLATSVAACVVKELEHRRDKSDNDEATDERDVDALLVGNVVRVDVGGLHVGVVLLLDLLRTRKPGGWLRAERANERSSRRTRTARSSRNRACASRSSASVASATMEEPYCCTCNRKRAGCAQAMDTAWAQKSCAMRVGTHHRRRLNGVRERRIRGS